MSSLNQLILVPARTDVELAEWGGGILSYARAFDSVTISNDSVRVRQGRFEHLTIVQPDFWPPELHLWIKQLTFKPQIEYLTAPNPQILAQILNVRVYFNLRFGFETAYDWSQLWAPEVSLIGLHGRADGELLERDFNIARTARLEAIKVTDHATPASIDALRAYNPGMFVMVRLIVAFLDQSVPRKISASDFVNWTSSNLERMFSNYPDIQYIEIHNEPNLILEGLTGSWQNGIEFANWFQEVVNAYRQFWPDKKYGFPGLSPGNTIAGVRQDSGSFLSEASLAAVSADWIGVHGYWQTEAQMHSLDGGFTWQRYRRLFPDKLLFITEFGNPTQPKAVVANQYARYYGLLRRIPGLGGAFSYISSTSDRSESARWSWTDETGRDVGIAREIGRRRFIR